MALTEKTVKRINELLEEIYKLINPEEVEPVTTASRHIGTVVPVETELEGIIGRPKIERLSGGLVRFTAGLGVTEGNLTRWIDLAALNDTAKLAGGLTKGTRVRVVGVLHETSYVDTEGVMRSKSKFNASVISPVAKGESVSSVASKLSGPNGTT